MDWKKIGKKLLFPPIWVVLLLVGISSAALVMVFVNDLTEHPIAYVVYVLSFYTLTILCVFCGMVFPKHYRAIRRKIYENPFGNRYMTDIEFKNHVSLYCSLAVNLLYVGMNAFFAWFYHTVWFGIFAGYYMILAVMRFLLVRYIHKNRLGKERLEELRRSRLCAVILTTINLVLPGAVLMILYQNRGFVYHGVLIYVMAMYTFYMTTTALVDLVKYRKYQNPVLSMSKVIKMAAALVSMLLLETAMFSSFGEEMSLQDQRIMIALTGAGISVIVITMAMYMIVRTTNEIKEMKNEQMGEIK